MNKQLFGLFLVLYGCYKIISSTLNELPDSLIKQVHDVPGLGVFLQNKVQNKDETIARHIFNLCFFIYGIDSLIHGLYLNRIGITQQLWILTHEGAYTFHALLGVFMFILFYGLFDVNESFYVVEGLYTGLMLMTIVPIMYIYNTWNEVSKLTPNFLIISSVVSIGLLLVVGRSIMLKQPERVPNIIDMVAILLNSL
jgi:hypothetical protein